MIETTILDDKKIAHFKVIGKYDLREILDLINTVYARLDHAVVWDGSKGDISNMTVHEMEQIARCCAEHADHKKTAFVGPDDLTFGLLRMYEAYAKMNRVAPVMMTFRTVEDAFNWITN